MQIAILYIYITFMTIQLIKKLIIKVLANKTKHNRLYKATHGLYYIFIQFILIYWMQVLTMLYNFSFEFTRFSIT